MKTYVIFDRKSGDVVQTHVRSDDRHGEMQDLLRELRPESKPDSLDVLHVTERLVPGTRYRVDTKVKKLVAVENTRGGISKKSMVHNSATPHIEVDAETYEVRADGELLTCAPAEVLPMAQRYFLF